MRHISLTHTHIQRNNCGLQTPKAVKCKTRVAEFSIKTKGRTSIYGLKLSQQRLEFNVRRNFLTSKLVSIGTTCTETVAAAF